MANKKHLAILRQESVENSTLCASAAGSRPEPMKMIPQTHCPASSNEREVMLITTFPKPRRVAKEQRSSIAGYSESLVEVQRVYIVG